MKQPGFLTMCSTKGFYIFFSSKTKEWKQQLHIAQTLSISVKRNWQFVFLSKLQTLFIELAH